MASSDGPISLYESTQKRCTYCFQELSEMTDPRLLPCQHIVCLTCLENDWKLDKLECRACGKYVNVITEELPKVKIAIMPVENTVVDADTITTDLKCETSKDCKEATKYCLDCGRLMCEDHHQAHNVVFNNDHEVLSGEIYAKRPDYFTRRRCQTHSSQLISMACQKCDELFCTSCIVDTCMKGGKHETFSMATMRQTLEAHFADMMKKCSEKVTELCKLEKQTWQTVDTLNEKCEDMIKHVEATAKRQIEEIQKRALEIKQDIANYQMEELSRVQLYITELTGKAEKLEQVQAKVKRFLHQSSTSTIVSKKKEQQDELIEAHNLDTSTEFDCDGKTIDKNGVVLSYRENEPFELVPHIPRTLTALPSVTTTEGRYCYSLDAGSYSDKLILSCSQYLMVYDFITQTFRTLRDANNQHVWSYDFTTGTFGTRRDTNNRSIFSVTHQRKSGDFYYMNDKGEVFELSIIPIDSHSLQNCQKLFSIKSSCKPSRLTVNNKYVVVANADGYRAMTFNLSTRTKKYHSMPKLGNWIRSLAFHPDGDLIILDHGSKISKYRLSDTKDPELVWECTEVSGAYALCVDEKRRLVYVTGSGHMMYIIEDGHVSKRIKYTGLPKYDHAQPRCIDITVCKDKLIATQNCSREILVLKMTW